MFLERFQNIEHLKKEFEITDKDLEGVDILYAAYRIESYDGQSIVLFKKDEKLFIIDAAHCSCRGLEGQWSPEETNEEALKKEIDAKRLSLFEEFQSFILFCHDYFKWDSK